MILTRHEIWQLIAEKKIIFSPPLDEFQNQPHAVDLRLGRIFYVPKIWKISARGREILTVDFLSENNKNFEKIKLKNGQFFELAPGESVIAATAEKISIREKNLMATLHPRSSTNRRGLSVDLTGIVDANYSGNLMIPIKNKTASQIIRIWPGERICQLIFQQLVRALDPADAQRYGKNPAKYENADAANLNCKKDADDEISLIKNGKIFSKK